MQPDPEVSTRAPVGMSSRAVGVAQIARSRDDGIDELARDGLTGRQTGHGLAAADRIATISVRERRWIGPGFMRGG